MSDLSLDLGHVYVVLEMIVELMAEEYLLSSLGKCHIIVVSWGALLEVTSPDKGHDSKFGSLC